MKRGLGIEALFIAALVIMAFGLAIMYMAQIP